ncbi:molybdopterin-dependent oxidoreductase [Chloroflexota bacterium]
MKHKEEIVIPTLCASHCGGACLLKVHVKDGVITRIETDESDEPMLRACLRGRAQRQRTYAKDRLLYPMKRVGERGEGIFKRISWDEALDTVASELKRVRDTYDSKSILLLQTGGDLTVLHTPAPFQRLLGMAGGYTGRWGAASFHGGLFGAYYTYGTTYDTSSRDDLLNSRLIIMWGWDPAKTVAGPSTRWFLTQAKERGIRIISIDPYYSDSTAAFAQEWIPIKPGTDAAMLIAMAFVMITENLQDQKFLDTYTIGFDEFRDYVLGLEDNVPKTPSWAEAITGVPASTIERLAREYATTKPAALRAGIGPGRTAFGEQYHRAAITLAAMTGNVGIHGGEAASRSWESVVGGYPFALGMGTATPYFHNPVETDTQKYPTQYVYPRVHFVDMADAVLKGKAGYPADYKMAFIINSNWLNSEPDSNKITKALQALEFTVILEQFMTPTAKYADIILPATTFFERNDIAAGVGMPYYGFQRKAIEPLGECRSHNEIAKELATRMGIDDFDNKTEEEHLREMTERAEIPDYETFKSTGIYKIPVTEPYVVFKKQIEDPKNNPFPSPSGKIEIYSQRIADMGDPLLPPIPKYIEPWESPDDPLAQKYPIQLVTNHAKRRALAQFDNIPWLRELIAQAITISTEDARARGISDGDMVKVFNDRGEVTVPAQVTRRIMPGVANLPSGAWYSPDEKGVDRGGCANVLTRDKTSPAGAYAYNTCLVQVEKV